MIFIVGDIVKFKREIMQYTVTGIEWDGRLVLNHISFLPIHPSRLILVKCGRR